MLYEDHKGNPYDTLTEMCSAYGISQQTYRARRKSGWSIREALETPCPPKNATVKDHKGKKYSSTKKMCEAYGITPAMYNSRLKSGLTQKEALEMPRKRQGDITDHLGKKYASMEEMCEEYGITVGAYYGRIRAGRSKKEALTAPLNSLRGQRTTNGMGTLDHKGIEYPFVKDMCAAYGVKPETYYQRIYRGATVEEALTTPVR